MTPVPVTSRLRITAWAMILFTLAMTAYQVSVRPPGRIDIDSDIFARIGRIASDGRLAEAYDLQRSRALARDYPTSAAVVPYAYPPTVSLAFHAMHAIPAWASYLLVEIPGLALFALTLRALAGAHRDALFVAATPAMILNLSTGQNGLLVAGFSGLVALGLRTGKTPSILTGAALLTLKPHLALAPPLTFLILRRWRAMIALGVIAGAIHALGILVYGWPVALAWLDSLRQSSAMLALGEAGPFPLRRMISVYGTLRAHAASHAVALTLHLGVALLAALAVIRFGTREAPMRTYALALLGTAFVSPYLYDYDAALFLIAVGILAAEGVYDRTRRSYHTSLVLVGCLPIPGFLTEWKLTGGVDIAFGAGVSLALALLVFLTVSRDTAAARIRRPFSSPAVPNLLRRTGGKACLPR